MTICSAVASGASFSWDTITGMPLDIIISNNQSKDKDAPLISINKLTPIQMPNVESAVKRGTLRYINKRKG